MYNTSSLCYMFRYSANRLHRSFKCAAMSTRVSGNKRKYSRNNNNNSRSNNNNNKKRDEAEPKQVHPGSYAHPEQQQLFNITVPDNKSDYSNEATVKRKVAIFLAYLGTGYNGMQINVGQKTIQAELELALYKAGCIHPLNFGYPTKYNYSVAGRTDKGVHACAQVVSLKIELVESENTTEQTLLQDYTKRINQHLPETIRVLDIVRTPRSFCAHTQRNMVRYQYMVPAFMVMYNSQQIHQVLAENNIKVDTGASIKEGIISHDDTKKLQAIFNKCRVDQEHLQRLRQALSGYVGTHSYHNLAKGVKHKEGRAMRYVVSFDVESPITISSNNDDDTSNTDNDIQWIPTRVTGQSFLMHQIRKMICLATDVARDAVEMDTIKHVITTPFARVNVAPPHGLFLEMSFYNQFNQRKNSQSDATTPDLAWDRKDSPVYEIWDSFRHDVIMKHIAEEELESGNFVKHMVLQECVANYKESYYIKDTDVNRYTSATNQDDSEDDEKDE